MSKFNKQTLQKLDKAQLIRLLNREGIEALSSQPKSELIRLLLLAKKANSPTKSAARVEIIPVKKRKWMALGGTLLVIFCALLLYFLNPTFNKNINFLVSSVFGLTQPADPEKTGPTIYEKNGKTYVVYDYPLIEVKVLFDPNCKRPECDLEEYYNQVKTYITPLVSFSEVEYDSNQGVDLATEYNLNLLPVFVFDEHLEKTENFENSKKNLEKIKDKYVLQVPPYKVMKGPNLANAEYLTRVENAPLTIVEYTGFSCKFCFDASQALKEVAAKYEGKVTRVVKYFNTGGNDTDAAIAAECAAQQGKFDVYYNTLFEKQAEWINLAKPALDSRFLSYATDLGVARPQFTQCVADENTRNIVLNHYSEAGSLGVSGAPTLFINNNVLVGAYEAKNLFEIIDDILATNANE
jgi:protein-disulfide isomerase